MHLQPLKTLSGVLLLAYLAAGDFCLGQETASPTERFLAEAPLKWVEYVKFARRLQGDETRKEYDLKSGRRLVNGVRWVWKQGPGTVVARQLSLDDKSSLESVLGSNPNYDFDLARKGADKPYVIQRLGNDASATRTMTGKTLAEDILHASAGGLQILNLWLPELIHDPAFTLKEARPVPRKGGQFYRVEFQYSPENRANNPVHAGWFMVNADLYWLISEYKISTADYGDGPAQVESTCYYKISNSGYPVLARVVTRTTGKVVREMEDEFKLTEQDHVSERDFELSGFGLPEPTEAPRASNWYLWAALAAFVCLGLAFVFNWLSRRRSPTAR